MKGHLNTNATLPLGFAARILPKYESNQGKFSCILDHQNTATMVWFDDQSTCDDPVYVYPRGNRQSQKVKLETTECQTRSSPLSRVLARPPSELRAWGL